jgi:hypothetical protein
LMYQVKSQRAALSRPKRAGTPDLGLTLSQDRQEHPDKT